jgi:endonuclease/exonuclease/phosphatase family metal-dependent hydrolase
MLCITGALGARASHPRSAARSVSTLVLLSAVWTGCSDRAAPARPDAGSTPPPDYQDHLFVVPALSPCDDTAPAPARLRVVTWNIKAARTMPLDVVASEMAAIDADIWLLQEVDAFTRRSGNVDQARLLAEQLGHEHAFASGQRFDGGEPGLAILSRLRFAAVERIWLDPALTSEQRLTLVVTLCRGAQEILVVNHHADVIPDGRIQNIAQVIGVLGGRIGSGMLFGGDLNDDPTGPVTRAVLEAGLIDVVEPHDTSGTYGQRRYDHVFADAVLAPAAVDGSVIDTAASDHEIVIADFAFE